MSIVQVAKLAGVSHTTVSRVINNESSVSPETAKRVHDVMALVGYTPKAPGLRRGPRRLVKSGFKTGNIAFLSAFKEGPKVMSSSPIMNNVFHGIEECISSYGLSLIQGSIGGGRGLSPIIARGEVDGVIVWPDLAGVSAETLRSLRGIEIVYVMSGGEYTLPGDRVMPNNREIGRLVAEHLVNNGHKELIFVTATHICSKDTTMRMRWESFSSTAKQMGANAQRFVANQTVLQSAVSDERADNILYESLSAIFKDGVGPSGMFVCYDSLTAKLYPMLNRLGVKPGKDIEIVSCNSEESFLAGLDPRPLSIDLQPEKIGKSAVEQLRLRVMNNCNDSQATIEIQPRLEI